MQGMSDSDWDEFISAVDLAENSLGPIILSSSDIQFRGAQSITLKDLIAPYEDAKETARLLDSGQRVLRDPGPDTFFKVGRSIELHFRYIWFGEAISNWDNRGFMISKVLYQLRQFLMGKNLSPSIEWTDLKTKEKITLKPAGGPWKIFQEHVSTSKKNKQDFWAMNSAHKEITDLRNGAAHKAPKSWEELRPLWQKVCTEMDKFKASFDRIFG